MRIELSNQPISSEMSTTFTSTTGPATTRSSPPPTPSALTTLLSTHSSLTSSAHTTTLPLEILHNLRHQHSWIDLRLHHPAPSSSYSKPSSRSTPRNGALKSSISDLDLTSSHLSSSHPSPPTSKISPPTTSSPLEPLHSPPLTLLSGFPPKQLYTHPDLQLQLLKAGIGTGTTTSSINGTANPEAPSTQEAELDLKPEREWVVPTTLAQKWTLKELCAVFDALPQRGPRRIYPAKPTSSTAHTASARSGSAEPREGSAGEGSKRKGASFPTTIEHQDAKRVLLAMKAHDGKGGDGTVVYYIVQEGEVKPRQN
jgi:tRNA-splicing endonuclease subunit Sen15, fungi type